MVAERGNAEVARIAQHSPIVDGEMLIKYIREDVLAAIGLDVSFRLIMNVLTHGQHDTARNQISSPSDASHDRLAIRRLARFLARRLGPDTG
jgi:hypothetical protein